MHGTFVAASLQYLQILLYSSKRMPTNVILLCSSAEPAKLAPFVLLVVTICAILVFADANDAAQFAELKTQGDLTRRAWQRDVQVNTTK